MSTHNLCFSQNMKNNVYPCKTQFHYVKVGFKWGGGGGGGGGGGESKLYRHVFVMFLQQSIFFMGTEWNCLTKVIPVNT